MISAIIVAAGGSRRMGFDKLSVDLNNLPVIAQSIRAFESSEKVAEIIVVTSADRIEFIESHRTAKVSAIIEGGSERHFSVWNGIQACAPDLELIAVHDGARPLVSAATIDQCAEVASAKGAATLAHRVVDTLKRSKPDSLTVADSVSREDLWAMETPQIFRQEILIPAYQKVIESGALVTDEVSAVQAAGHDVHFVENTEPNLKITVPGDLELARALFTSK